MINCWIKDKLGDRDPLDIGVEELEFSVRALNCFKNEGIRTVRDLVVLPEAELLRVPNFGRRTLREVKEILAVFNLQLRDTVLMNVEEQMTHAMTRARAAKVAYAEAVLEIQRIAKRMADLQLDEVQP